MISIRNLHYSVGKTEIIKGINADLLPGKCTMILGPNGSGKSSFLKLFSGSLNPDQGEIIYENEKLSSIKKEEIAKVRAVLSQSNELSFPLTVSEVVMMGRYPHFNFSPSENDDEIVREVIALVSLNAFAERNYLTLSGGEKQRVQFARVLAQIWKAPANTITYLFMDEPLTGLDINYQQEFLKIAKSLLTENLVLVAVMHDINLASQYGDELIVLSKGNVAAAGSAEKVLNPKLIRDVFNVSSIFIDHPVTGKPLMIYDEHC
jgi:iron complex transport system ATP-binding protein